MCKRFGMMQHEHTRIHLTLGGLAFAGIFLIIFVQAGLPGSAYEGPQLTDFEWTDPVLVSVDAYGPRGGWTPVLEKSDHEFLIAYVKQREGGQWYQRDVFMRESVDWGETWSDETKVAGYTASNHASYLFEDSDGKIWMGLNFDTGGCDAGYMISLDGGETWEDPVNLVTWHLYDWATAILEDRSHTIWFVVSDLPWNNGPANILCQKSSDMGDSWGPLEYLTDRNDYYAGRGHVFQASNGTYFLLYSGRDVSTPGFFRYSLHMAKSLDGETWSPDIRVLSNFEETYDGNCNLYLDREENFWLIWPSDRSGQVDLWITASTDWGKTWSDPAPVTNDEAIESNYGIYQDSRGHMWVTYVADLAGMGQSVWLRKTTTPVSLKTPAQLLDELMEDVEDMNLQQGIENGLDAKLENAQQALEAANAGNRQDAINKLEAFINAVEAQRGKKLTNEQADHLVAKAQEIIDRI